MYASLIQEEHLEVANQNTSVHCISTILYHPEISSIFLIGGQFRCPVSDSEHYCTVVKDHRNHANLSPIFDPRQLRFFLASRPHLSNPPLPNCHQTNRQDSMVQTHPELLGGNESNRPPW